MDQALAGTPERTTPAHGVSLAAAFRVWLRVAVLSFGGPAGQIATMHRILVEEKKWIGETRFLHADGPPCTTAFVDVTERHR